MTLATIAMFRDGPPPARPQHVLYPVSFGDRRLYLQNARRIQGFW
ncbi:MAG: hypothetical protein U5K36_09570 [Roseovarius sp.]|nr:hypothetical protein [Roseovarius sp.]